MRIFKFIPFALLIIALSATAWWKLSSVKHNQPLSLAQVKALKEKLPFVSTSSPDNRFVLGRGQLVVKENDNIIWQSPSEWWVDSFELADANNDGKIELAMSVWKEGNYGTSKPFWVKENDKAVKNHFFVMSIENNQVRPLWQSSNLEKPNCEFTFADSDNDGKIELNVIEGEYGDDYICEGKYLARWEWNGWGFANEWRSERTDKKIP